MWMHLKKKKKKKIVCNNSDVQILSEELQVTEVGPASEHVPWKCQL